MRGYHEQRNRNFVNRFSSFCGWCNNRIITNPTNRKENRQWIHDQSEDAKHWLEEKGSKILDESERRLGEVSKKVKTSVKENLPDLYEATESLEFDDEELESNE